MIDRVAAGAGSGVSSAQAASRLELANGRNLDQIPRRVEVPVQRGRQHGPPDRLPSCVHTATSLQQGDSPNAPSTDITCSRRSRSTRAAPTQRPSSACGPTVARTSRCANRSTSWVSHRHLGEGQGTVAALFHDRADRVHEVFRLPHIRLALLRGDRADDGFDVSHALAQLFARRPVLQLKPSRLRIRQSVPVHWFVLRLRWCARDRRAQKILHPAVDTPLARSELGAELASQS